MSVCAGGNIEVTGNSTHTLLSLEASCCPPECYRRNSTCRRCRCNYICVAKIGGRTASGLEECAAAMSQIADHPKLVQRRSPLRAEYYPDFWTPNFLIYHQGSMILARLQGSIWYCYFRGGRYPVCSERNL